MPCLSVTTSSSTSPAAPPTGAPWATAKVWLTGPPSTPVPSSGATTQRAAFKNWEEVTDLRNPLGGRQGVDERIMLREFLRRVDMMVILENKLDALVRLHTPYPPALIGGANQSSGGNNIRQESTNGPNAGLTEVLIPAGYVQTAYDPVFRLSEDGARYESAPSTEPTTLDAPGLPFSLVFRTEPGKEDLLLSIASSYESATHRRVCAGFRPASVINYIFT